MIVDFYTAKLYNVTDKNRGKHFQEAGGIPAQVRYCTVRYWMLFQDRISCGNREKTDRKEALLSGQGFFYLRNRWDVTIPEARIAGSL